MFSYVRTERVVEEFSLFSFLLIAIIPLALAALSIVLPLSTELVVAMSLRCLFAGLFVFGAGCMVAVIGYWTAGDGS